MDQTNQDLEHLRVLSIFHYVLGGLTMFFGLFPLMHVAFGAMMVFAPHAFEDGGPPPPMLFGLFFMLVGLLFVLLAQAMGVLLILGGRNLVRHQRHTFCMVVAGLSCLIVPLGTVLGIFTILVLQRPSVRNLFAETQRTQIVGGDAGAGI